MVHSGAPWPSTLLAALLLSATVAAGQSPDPACANGLIYDDGTFENAYGLVASAGRRSIVMRIDPPPGSPIERVCLCWIRNTADTDLDFNLVFYTAEATSGEPGSPIASLSTTVSAIPNTPPGAFFSFDVSSAGLVAPPGGLYVGAEWDAAAELGFFLCADQDGPSTQPGFSGVEGQWRDLTIAHPDYKALAIRTELGEPPCQPDAETLCLRDGRFQVEVAWQTPAGATGRGHPVEESSDDSGMFWFFNPQNWEFLVKILDGCAINDHYWVFSAATTNVGYTLSVTDTRTATVNHYDNPIGSAAAALTDTSAFATCP